MEIELSRPADQNPVLVYLATLSTGSRRTIEGALRLVAETFTGKHQDIYRFPWWQFRYAHLMKVRSDLAERFAPATCNKALGAARQVLRHCRRLGLMTAEDCAAATDIHTVRGYRIPKGRALSASELERILDSISSGTKLGKRNRALVFLLAYGGLRRNELSELDLADYNANAETLKIRGKGNKERLLPVNKTLAGALRDWLSVRGFIPGPLFCRGSAGDNIFPGRSFSPDGIYKVVIDLGKRAAILKISPHDFRRTFISALLDLPANDLATVSKLVGHASVVTTMRYDRRDEKAKRRAVDSLENFIATHEVS